MTSPELPTCNHDSCDHFQRLEYCEIEAEHPNGDAAFCIEAIEHLMYERGNFETGMRYTNDGEVRYISRDFEYLHGDIESWVWPLLETRVGILHEHHTQTGMDMYQVRVGWRSHQKGSSEDFYETVYTYEQWPGVIYSTIDEYELSTRQFITHEAPVHRSRSMTGYDHEKLFETLSIVDNMRMGEGYEIVR